MKQKLQDMKCNIKDIKKYIVPVIVALVIAMLEVLGEMLDLLQQRSDGVAGIAVGTKQIVGFGIKAFLLWVIIFIVLILGWKYGKRAYCGKTSVCPVFRKKMYVWLAIVISWIPCFIAYFPGIYSYDGEPQLLQYTSGNFDNHHPVFHTLILGGCYDLGQWLQAKGIMIDGIAFYSIIQMAVLGFALASVVMLLTRRGAGRVIQWITMAMFCLFPATPIIAISTTKDTLFTAVFVMVVVKCLEMLETKILTKKIAIEICVYAVLCMLFRRNASYVALLMLLVLAIVYLVNAIGYKKWTWNTLAGCIAICFVSILLFNIAEKSIMAATSAIQGESAEALSVPLMQMARAYKSNQEDATVKYGEELYEYISPLGLSNYRPLISDGVKQGFNNELFGKEKTDFVKIYLKMFKSYPGSYIQAFLYMTKGDWQLMDNTHCEVYKDWWRNRTGYLITDATEVFALGCVVFAFIGAAFVIHPTAGLASFPALVGMLSGLCAGTAYVFVRKLGTHGERGPVIVCFFSVFSTIILTPLMIMSYKPMSPKQWIFLILCGLSATGGQLGITAAYTHAPANISTSTIIPRTEITMFLVVAKLKSTYTTILELQ